MVSYPKAAPYSKVCMVCVNDSGTAQYSISASGLEIVIAVINVPIFTMSKESFLKPFGSLNSNFTISDWKKAKFLEVGMLRLGVFLKCNYVLFGEIMLEGVL